MLIIWVGSHYPTVTQLITIGALVTGFWTLGIVRTALIKKINKDQEVRKKCESYRIVLGKQQEMKELEILWAELQFETVLRITTLHTGCCKNHCSYTNLSPKVYHGKLQSFQTEPA